MSPIFFNDTTWTPTAANSSPNNFEALGGSARRAEYERLDNDTVVTLLNDARGSNASVEFMGLTPKACMDLYAVGFLERASDVVVVTDATATASSPLIWTRYPERSISLDKDNSNEDSFNWICHDALEQQTLSEARVSYSRPFSHCVRYSIDPLATRLPSFIAY